MNPRFFYEAHRAEEDCYALLEILQQRLPKTGDIVLKTILNALPKKSYKVFALGSSFDKKDMLKQRGYRWDSDKKVWHMIATGDDPLKAEIEWLKANVYGGKQATVDIEVQNCLTRFSRRPGKIVSKGI